MASASEERINQTLAYLTELQKKDQDLHLFPIHCTGHAFLDNLKKVDLPGIHAFDVSVGTKFTF
jgi:metal-dependent hydrolase (beta-lactamase superfamily II)